MFAAILSLALPLSGHAAPARHAIPPPTAAPAPVVPPESAVDVGGFTPTSPPARTSHKVVANDSGRKRARVPEFYASVNFTHERSL